MRKINSNFFDKAFPGSRQEAKEISLENRERLMKYNKYLTNPAVLAGFAVGIFLLLVLCLNGLANGITALVEKEKISFFAAIFSFQKKYLAGYAICFLLAIAAFLRIWLGFYFAFRSLNVGQKGTSRWTTRAELAAQYRLIPEKKEPFSGGGGVPVARTENGIYIDDSPVNNLIIGISRSGKGELIVFPEIDIYSRAEKKASLVINDPKLELCAASMDTLKKRGYEVHVLNLVDPLLSMGYNPLTAIVEEYKSGNEAGAEELCAALCTSIFTSDAQNSSDGTFWSDNSIALLSALILASCEDNIREDRIENARRKAKVEEENQRRKEAAIRNLSAEERRAYYISQEIKERQKEDAEVSSLVLAESILGDTSQESLSLITKLKNEEPILHYTKLSFVATNEHEKKINMRSIYNTFSTLSATQINSKKNALDLYFESRPEGNRARLKYATIGAAGDKTKGSIYSNTLSKLKVFTYDNIAKMTARSSVDMLSVGFGEKPVAIFLGLPDYDRSNWFIATVFISQLYYTLAKAATHNATRGMAGKCNNEVVFILDEFGNMPPIDDMSNIITVCLGRNIRFNLVIQDFAQIENLYGKNAATIRSNCANQIYIMTNDKDTAETYSALLGNETYTNVNRSGKRFSLDKEYIENQEEQPLMDKNQLMNLKEGEMIVSRVIKRRDLKGKDIAAYPIASLGEHKMKYRYQYLIDDFPNRTLTDLTDLENVENVDLAKITWSCENYLKKTKLYEKYIRDKAFETKDGGCMMAPGLMSPTELQQLREVFALSKQAAQRYSSEIEPEMTLGMLYQIALNLYSENLKKSIALFALIDEILKRNHVAVSDLTINRRETQLQLSQDLSKMTEVGT